VEWQDELTLIAETAAENRVNKNGFAVKPEESARTVFCNKKTVGYSEYFKSQQTGKLVEAKYEVHKADYGGEDVVEVNGRRYFAGAFFRLYCKAVFIYPVFSAYLAY